MFNLIPLDDQIPKGNNSLGSFALYYQRAKYYDYSTEIVESDVSVDGKLKFSFINTLEDGREYGKIDNQGNYILLDLNNTKNYSNIRIQNKNIIGIDLFNVFAKDFINDYNNFIQLYRIPSDSLFTSVDIKQLQTQHQFIYNNHLTSLIEKWKLIFNFPELYKEINDTKSLIKFCLNYIKEYSISRPTTKTGFASSKYFNITNTGLCLQIGNTDPSDDLKKYQRILKDPVFNLFADFARRKGFMIDKVNPYNLYLDFNNKYFLNTLNKQSDNNEKFKINLSGYSFDFTNVDEFFQKRYIRADKYDYDNLLALISKMVNEFSNSPLTSKKPKYCFQDGQTYVRFKELNIPNIKAEDVLKYITTTELIEEYVNIRSNESNVFLEKKQVNKIVNKFIDQYKVIGTEKAIYKINDELRSMKMKLDRPM